MTNKTLMKAILAMDSYSRGYGQKIENLPDPKTNPNQQIKIGNAIIGIQSDVNKNSEAFKAGFYAISYTYDNETIISYRGTDNYEIFNSSSDIWRGWTGGAGYESNQAKLAADFLKTVIDNANPYNVNVEFVGHSLGGGLAGLMASLYHQKATVFDNMPFENSAINVYNASTLNPSDPDDQINTTVKNQYYFGATPDETSGSTLLTTPLAPNNSQITAYAVTGEPLTVARAAQATSVTYFDSNGGTRSPIDLHSQALLVTLLYASQESDAGRMSEDWNKIGKDLMNALFNNDIAKTLGIMDNKEPTQGSADKMLTKIAYSAIDEGERVFGDTAIRALFNDANDLGGAVDSSNLASIFQGATDQETGQIINSLQSSIAKMLVQFAGKLAEDKVLYSSNSQAVEGMLKLSDTSDTLTIKLSSSIWGTSTHFEKAQMLNNLYAKFGITDTSIMPNASAVENVILTTTNDGSDYGAGEGGLLENINGTNLFFGADGVDTLNGSIGKDMMFGGKGNDHLSGGLGNDKLNGGQGSDTLDGGDNNDTLDGGNDDGSSDTLEGGSDSDTYLFNNFYGSDTINDDGLGDNAGHKDIIKINNQIISGTANYVKNAEGTYTLGSCVIKKSGNDIQILSYMGNITVTNFQNGDYGITLKDKPSEEKPDEDVTSQIGAGEQATIVRRSDPLTLDLNHNGKIDLIALNQSNARFDLQGNGLKHKVGWVGGNDANHDGIIDDVNNNGSRLDDADGFLVLDSNNNGVVDNIDELFGHKNADGTTTTGTEELRLYDSNLDGKIDSNDNIFSQLKIWQDFNGNGTTDAGELSSLNDHNIKSISVDSSTSNQNINGNVVLSTGTFEFTDPTNINPNTNLPRTITTTTANLDLAFDPVNSESYEYQDSNGNNISPNINNETLFLPLSRGYGNTKAWHIAMSEDSGLLQMMKDMVNLTGGTNLQNLNQKIEDFIYRWTGSENVSGMRGSFDGKKLAALEAFRGLQYTDNTGSHNVADRSVGFLQNAWNNLVKIVTDRILTQGTFKDIFTDHNSETIAQVSYDFATDKLDFSKISGAAVIQNIKEHYESLDTIEGAYYLKAISPIINSVSGKFSDVYYYQFITNLTNAVGEIPNQILIGTDGDDVIGNSSWSNSLVKGGKGDDTINNYYSGNDVYIYAKGDGNDIITDGWGNDTIKLDSSINKNDVYFTLQNQYDLVIHFTNSPSDSITIKNHFNYHSIETLKFADGSTIDLTHLPAFQTNGTDGDDVINTGNADDIINAGAGNDSINGGDGNDSINGGDGNDLINGGYGNDIINGGKGDDIIGYSSQNNSDNNFGNDTYIYNKGDGKDIINENVSNYNPYYNPYLGNDTIKFGGDILKSDLYFTVSDDRSDLIIRFKNSPDDQITIKNQFGAGGIENLQFDNGEILSTTNLTFEYQGTDDDDTIEGVHGNSIINSGNGNDYIYTNGGNNIINAGKGDDIIMSGGAGNYTYLYSKGDGQDTIYDGHGNDVIIFDNISKDDVYLSQNENDLIIHFKNSPNDQITIKYQFYNVASIKALQFNNGNNSIDLTNPNNLNFEYKGSEGDDNVVARYGHNVINTFGGNDVINVGASYSIAYGGTVDNIINAGDGNDIINAYGNYDTISAGKGDDVITGGYGNDTYLYSKGDGRDVINDGGNYYYNNSSIDSIVFDATINKDDVFITQSINDVIIHFNNSPLDQITIKNHFHSNGERIEILKFSNGDVIDLTTLIPSYDGTDGDDVINAGATNDIINAGAGNDTINDSGGNNTINGGAGNDIINANGYGDDTINGDDGNDTINAGSGNDVISGGDGNDTINGEDGNDIINAGRGDDIIGYNSYYHSGDNLGNDTYIYNKGDGKDIINENPSGYNYGNFGNDIIKFGADISASDIYFSQNGSDLIVRFRSSPDDQITIKNQLNFGYYDNRAIETLQFDNGDSSINIANTNNFNFEYNGTNGDDVVNVYRGSNTINTFEGNDRIDVNAQDKDQIINSGDGDDVINVYGNHDTINAGRGNDTINGGSGNDNYLYSKGDGKDIINDGNYYYAPNNSKDSIVFDASISKNDLVMIHSGYDLIINFTNSPDDQITIKNHFHSLNERIETLKFSNGDLIDLTTVPLGYNGTDGVDIINSGSGDDNIYAGDGNDIIYSGYGNDIINGGRGDDTISGDAYGGANYGNDTYIYNKGDGKDIIIEASNDYYNQYNNYNTGTDVIKFGVDISKNDIYFSRNNNDLIINFRSSPDDKITIKDQFFSINNYVETLQFDNGDASVDITNPLSLTFEYLGTDGNDIINGSASNDIINAGKGDDIISGGTGNDGYLYSKGDGKDIISNIGGHDVIIFDSTIDKNDISLVKNGYDLIISFNNSPNDQITISNHFSKGSRGYIDALQFSNGDAVDLINIPGLVPEYHEVNNYGEIITFYSGNKIINGTDGNNNIITGAGGDDIINGGKGDDRILSYDDKILNLLNNASSGNDTYLYSKGDGKDTIFDNGGNDAIVFDSTINKENIVITAGTANTYQQYDLIISFSDSASDQITIQNFFSPDYQGKIESLKFSGGDVVDLTALTFNYNGTAGNDVINASNGNDLINAGSGSDTINALGGDDIINAGSGSDTINGGDGNDVYIYNIGDGNDVISESQNYYNGYNNRSLGTDTIKFGEGISKDDIYFSANSSNLVIHFRNSLSDSITIQNQFNFYSGTGVSPNNIEILQFYNGDVMNISDISTLTFEYNGTSGNDTIYASSGNDLINTFGGNDIIEAYSGNDIINAGRGDDVIGQGNGGAGNDTYVYNKGDGNDTIYETYQYYYPYSWSPTSNGTDIIKFGADISRDDIYFSSNGNDLIIKFRNSLSDSITIKDQFRYEVDRIETLQFDNGDVAIDISNPSALSFEYHGTNDNDYIYASNGNDMIDTSGGDDTIYSLSGNDIINAGFGNDNISGGDGNDTYVYNKGDGQDRITESDYSNGNDVIQFGDGIFKSDISFSKSGSYDLVISFKNSGSDSITIQNYFYPYSTNYRIETLKFVNGDTLDISNPANIKIEINGTDGSDYIQGGDVGDVINAKAGNDNIYAMGGDDIINAGSGDDYINGGYGDDTYLYNKGDGKDIINENSGSDKIILGADISSNDIELARSGNDLIIHFKNDLSNSITIQNHFYNNPYSSDNYKVETLQFTNGDAAIDLTQVNPDFNGTDGNDYISSYGGGHNVFNAGKGDDYIYSSSDIYYGGGGVVNDTNTYIYKKGDGKDTIYENGFYYSNNGSSMVGTIKFGADISAGDVVFSQSGYNLVINFASSPNDQITIQNHFYGANNVVENIQFDNGDAAINLASLAFDYNGTAGNDVIYGSYKNDTINAGAGNDAIYGGSGDDIINAGLGDDQISDDNGNDTYIYNKGDGKDTINENSGADIIKFGVDISAGDVYFTRGPAEYYQQNNLIINFRNNPNDSITIQNYFSYESLCIETLQFENGDASINMTTQTFETNGTSGDDYIYSGYTNDIINAGDGNDNINAGGGHNVFNAGKGDDYIYSSSDIYYGGGGVVNDTNTYIYKKGDGKDTIYENGFYYSNNGSSMVGTIKFGADILISDIYFTRDNNDLIINFNNSSSDKITIKNQFRSVSDRIETLQFNNGYSLNLPNSDNPSLEIIVPVVNNAPTVNIEIEDQSVLVGNQFAFTIPAESFTDIDGDVLTYSAKLSSGDPLPYWLSFNPITKSFTGNPPYGNVGNISITITASDKTESSSQTFNLNIEDNTINGTSGNDVILGTNLNDLIIDAEGDNLIDAGTGNDAILTKGAGNNIIDGGLGNDYVYFGGTGNNTIRGGEGFDAIYAIQIESITSQINPDDLTYNSGNNILEGGLGSDSVFGGIGNDIYLFNQGDGIDIIGEDVLHKSTNKDQNYGYDKIKFGAGITANDIYFERVGYGQNDLIIKFSNSPTDLIFIYGQFSEIKAFVIEEIQLADGSTISLPNFENQNLTVVVNNVNHAPVATITSSTTNEDTAKIIDVLAQASDVDSGDILSISTITNPIHGTATIIVNPQTGYQTISYVPTSNYFGNDSFDYTISDGNGGFVTKTININISAVNDAPIVNVAISNQSVSSGNGFNFTIPADAFSDIDSAALTYSATLEGGGALPIWLHFNSATKTFSGNFYGASSTLALSITASDGSASATQNFHLDMTGNLISGTNGNDSILGSSQNDVLDGGLGNDILSGGEGNDAIFGGAGNDTITAALGDDFIDGGAGADNIKGGNGNDTVSYQNSSAGVNVQLNSSVKGLGGDAQGDVLAGIENLIGSAFNDKLYGSDNNNILRGNDGDDLVAASIGNDIIEGGKGNDIVIGDKGNDTYIYNIGDGVDRFAESADGASDGNDVIEFGNGISKDDIYFTTDNTINNSNLIIKFKNSPNDQITIYNQFGSSSATIETIKFNDGSTLDISNPNNLTFEYRGTQNNDSITGSGYNNQITGGDGNDIINGNTGNDLITGGAGKDTLTGGNGADTFIFKFFSESPSTINSINGTIDTSNIDTITDFVKGEDKINLHNLNLLDHLITFDENPNDASIPQGLSYHFDSDNNTIITHHDNDQGHDFAVKLVGNINLGSGDFEF